MRQRTADRLATSCIVAGAVLSVVALMARLRAAEAPVWIGDVHDIARMLFFFGIGITVGRRARAT